MGEVNAEWGELPFGVENDSVVWERDPDNQYLFHARWDGLNVSMRLNDFPEESLFTFFVEGSPVAERDQFPRSWRLPDPRKNLDL